MLKRQFRGVSFSPPSPTTRSLSRKRTTFGAERPLHPHVTAHDKGRNNDAETKRLIIYQSTAAARTMHTTNYVGTFGANTTEQITEQFMICHCPRDPTGGCKVVQRCPRVHDRPTIRDKLLNPNGLGSPLPTHTQSTCESSVRACILCSLKQCFVQ